MEGFLLVLGIISTLAVLFMVFMAFTHRDEAPKPVLWAAVVWTVSSLLYVVLRFLF